MADVVLPVVGAAVGFAQGGPQGAMIGMQIGSMAAGALTRVKLPTKSVPNRLLKWNIIIYLNIL